jgi:hypothetical protein
MVPAGRPLGDEFAMEAARLRSFDNFGGLG